MLFRSQTAPAEVSADIMAAEPASSLEEMPMESNSESFEFDNTTATAETTSEQSEPENAEEALKVPADFGKQVEEDIPF